MTAYATVLSPSTLDFALKSPRPLSDRKSSLINILHADPPAIISPETRSLAWKIDDSYTRQRANLRRGSKDLCHVVKSETKSLLQGRDQTSSQGMLERLVSEFSILQSGPHTASKDDLPAATMAERHIIFPKVRQLLREIQADCLSLVRKGHSRQSSVRGVCASSLDNFPCWEEHDVPKLKGHHSLREALEPLVHPNRHLNAAEAARERVVFTAGHHVPSDALILLAA